MGGDGPDLGKIGCVHAGDGNGHDVKGESVFELHNYDPLIFDEPGKCHSLYLFAICGSDDIIVGLALFPEHADYFHFFFVEEVNFVIIPVQFGEV